MGIEKVYIIDNERGKDHEKNTLCTIDFSRIFVRCDRMSQ